MHWAHILAALISYLFWGLLPIYYHHLSMVPPLEMVAYRIVFAVPLLLVFLRVRLGGLWVQELRSALRLPTLWLCASMLICNWLVYVWSVQQDRVVEASLGYFINPMVYVLFGVIFFRERLSQLQKLGVFIVLIAIAIMVWQSHAVPWIALVLAFSFAIYGSFHKTVKHIKPLAALSAELIVLLPVALSIVGISLSRGTLVYFDLGRWDTLLAISAGSITAVPLLLFVIATERISLSFIGVMQYIAPTLQFLIAVFIFGEPFDSLRKTAFMLVWCGIFVFVIGLWRRHRATIQVA